MSSAEPLAAFRLEGQWAVSEPGCSWHISVLRTSSGTTPQGYFTHRCIYGSGGEYIFHIFDYPALSFREHEHNMNEGEEVECSEEGVVSPMGDV